jgi:hypothetical protein
MNLLFTFGFMTGGVYFVVFCCGVLTTIDGASPKNGDWKDASCGGGIQYQHNSLTCECKATICSSSTVYGMIDSPCRCDNICCLNCENYGRRLGAPAYEDTEQQEDFGADGKEQHHTNSKISSFPQEHNKRDLSTCSSSSCYCYGKCGDADNSQVPSIINDFEDCAESCSTECPDDADVASLHINNNETLADELAIEQLKEWILSETFGNICICKKAGYMISTRDIENQTREDCESFCNLPGSGGMQTHYTTKISFTTAGIVILTLFGVSVIGGFFYYGRRAKRKMADGVPSSSSAE